MYEREQECVGVWEREYARHREGKASRHADIQREAHIKREFFLSVWESE